MMSARPETKKPAIQHVRKPSYRMPVTDLGKSKRPQNSFASKSGSNGWVLINVDVVIIIDESMPNGLAECDPDERRQKNADTLDNGPFTVEDVVPPKTFRADSVPHPGNQVHQKTNPSESKAITEGQRAKVSAQSRFAAIEVLPGEPREFARINEGFLGDRRACLSRKSERAPPVLPVQLESTVDLPMQRCTVQRFTI